MKRVILQIIMVIYCLNAIGQNSKPSDNSWIIDKVNKKDYKTKNEDVVPKNDTKSRGIDKSSKSIENPSKTSSLDAPKPEGISDYISPWSLGIELGVLPVNSANSKTIISPMGLLEFAYNIKDALRIGLLGQTMFYHHNVDLTSIDSKIIDLSSCEYNSVGLSLGYKIKAGKFEIMPKVDMLYNIFVAKATDFELDRKNFLDYRYITLDPKLYLGFRLNEFTSIGINGGYNTQVTAIKGQKINAFDPNGIHGNLFLNYYIKK